MVSPKSSKVFFKDKQDKTCLLLLLKEKKKQSLKFENYTYLMSTHQFFWGGVTLSACGTSWGQTRAPCSESAEF